MTKPTEPLTREEVATAAELFFELFDVVLDQAPSNTSIEEALKMSESIFNLAHKLRSIGAEVDASAKFGFNKKES